MKLIISIAIALIAFPLLASSGKANSVTLSTDSIEYEGYNLTGHTFAVNSDLGKKYGYELAIGQTDTYQLNEQQGKLSIKNKIDINNISLGLYRVIKFGDFSIKPIAGFVYYTVNVNTKYRYQDELDVFTDSVGLDLFYETYTAKSAVVPMYGAKVGYSLTSNIDVFYSYKQQGFTLNSVGLEIRF